MKDLLFVKVLFVYPSDNLTFNAGIGYLSAILKNSGHKTALYMTNRFDEEELLTAINGFSPDITAVSAVTNQFRLAKRLIKSIKLHSNSFIALGGVHATLQPQEAIAINEVDAICRGEGEEALLELVDLLENEEDYRFVRNFWVKDGDKLYKNPLRPLLTNIDSLPGPDYEVFNYEKILRQMGVFMVFANRGCPYKCSYCVNHSLLELYGAKNFVRYMSVSHLIDLIKKNLRRYPETTIIEFFDDTFILNRQWMIDFCEAFPREINKPFYCNVRANLIDEEIVEMLQKAGCIRVNMAIETGSEVLRKNVLKKNVTDDELITAFNLFKKAGIKTYAHNMVGIPYETEENILKSIELNKQCNVDDLQCWVFYPYPGTKAREICEKNDWLTDRLSDTVAGKIVASSLDQPGISFERVSYYFRIFKFLVLGEKAMSENIPLDYIFLGVEEGQMISGLNNLEIDKGIPFRWTQQEGSFYLKNSKKKYLMLYVNFPAPKPPPLVEVIVNGLNLSHFIPQKGVWEWYEIKLPPFDEPILEITLKVDKPYLPQIKDPGDKRVLGVTVSKIALENSLQKTKRLISNLIRRNI